MKYCFDTEESGCRLEYCPQAETVNCLKARSVHGFCAEGSD